MLAGFVGLVWLTVTLLPAMAHHVVPAGERHGVLDGFRGLLAVAVLLHHGILLRQQASGSGATLVPLDLFLGRGAVAFFFMASAALFVGQIMQPCHRWTTRAFYAGRIRRVVPLYVIAVMGVVAVVGAEAGGVAAPVSLVADAGRWLFFDFVARPDLNGISGSAGYLGPVWSLRYEWLLYAILPILAVAYRRTGNGLVVYAGLAAAAVPIHLFALFLAGAVAVPVSRMRFRHADAVLTVAAVAGIGAALLLVDEFASARAAPLLLPTFIVVLRGRSPLVAWMAALPMRFLGQISYSLYLLHDVVLTVAVKHVDVLHRLLIGSTAGFILLVEGMFVAILLFATATYLAIERPFQRPGALTGGLTRFSRLVGRGVPRGRLAAADLPLPQPSAA